MQNVSDMTEPKLPGTPPNGDYVIELHGSLAALSPAAWNSLLAAQDAPTPFMRHEYLSALHDSRCASAESGWLPLVFVLRGAALQAAAVLYVKNHSYGEYVFDWAWADAYARHGRDYYPKATLAVPFTPVPGSRILARDDASRTALLQGMLDWAEAQGLSSLHLLFGSDADLRAARGAGLMARRTVQFHWCNRAPLPYADFDDFLAGLSHDKRKKIRQERRRVAQAGVSFRHLAGQRITAQDWAFFYRCYERTYLQHGNAPYLSPDFFARMAANMPGHWAMFIAERGGQPIASSLIALQPAAAAHGSQDGPPAVAYGRYWGALEDVSCLHFEACYYQPIAWCIAHGIQRFEGGAQGEHKMARALLPVQTASAHWLADAAFTDAVGHFLERETEGVSRYVEHLQQRTPFRRQDG